MAQRQSGYALHCGDCLEVLPTLADNSFDSCVTDPPYHLTSIVKRFGSPTAKPVRVGNINATNDLKAAHARAAAGFMGKQWDGGDIAFRPEVWGEVYRVLKPGAHLLAFGGTRTYHRMACAIEDAGFEIRDTIMWLYGSGFPKSHNIGNGWGTALKPACEPIVLARKPLSEGTVAANVLKHGVGALNIDGTRIPTNPDIDDARLGGKGDYSTASMAKSCYGKFEGKRIGSSTLGRWPANLIHDGSEGVVEWFPETVGQFAPVGPRNGAKFSVNVYGDYGSREQFDPRSDGGSAARFFYTAKADSDDRLGSKHPTVKPLDLMQYLVRLVTSKGGTVLDPFAGTGTTGEAAWREGMKAALIEREAEYQDDIRRRMKLCLAGPAERARETIKQKLKDRPSDDGPLFAAVGKG